MYFSDLSRTVQSFNYGTTESGQTTAQGATGTRQLINQNYGICVAAAPGYCSIDWQISQSNSFTLSNDTAASAAMIGTPAASVTGVGCTTDFIVIPNPLSGATRLTYDRFCGNGLPTITSKIAYLFNCLKFTSNLAAFSKPYVLTVVTDNDELNDVANRGFSLDYAQRRCTSLLGTP